MSLKSDANERCVRRGRRNWPFSFYGGIMTQCGNAGLTLGAQLRGGLDPRAKARLALKVREQIKEESGLPVDDAWHVVPFNCGDATCSNHHHWRVVRYWDDASPPLPSHPGYIQLAADEMEQVQRIVDGRRDAGEAAWVVQRSNKSRMYSMIKAALSIRSAREEV